MSTPPLLRVVEREALVYARLWRGLRLHQRHQEIDVTLDVGIREECFHRVSPLALSR